MTRHGRLRMLAVVGVSLAWSVTAGCSPVDVLPAPSCEGGASNLIVAQSVPTATQVPCLERLPDGWSVAAVRVNDDGSEIRLDSDRAGEGAAVLRYDRACAYDPATQSPSELPPALRYDEIEQLEPGFRATRFYVFAGGCVSWRFDFDDGASATESVAIGDALGLVSREALNRSIRESFIDEEV